MKAIFTVDNINKLTTHINHNDFWFNPSVAGNIEVRFKIRNRQHRWFVISQVDGYWYLRVWGQNMFAPYLLNRVKDYNNIKECGFETIEDLAVYFKQYLEKLVADPERMSKF